MSKLQQVKEIKLFDSKIFKEKKYVRVPDYANINDLEKTHLYLKDFFRTKPHFLSTQAKKSQSKRNSFPRIQQTNKNLSEFFSQKQSRHKLSRWTRIKTIDYNRQINQQLSIQKIKSQSNSLSPKKVIFKIQVPSSDRKSQKPSKGKSFFIQSPKRMEKKLQIAFQNSLILNKQKQSSLVDNFPNCIKFKRKKFPQLKKSMFQNNDSNRYYSPWDVKIQSEQF